MFWILLSMVWTLKQKQKRIHHYLFLPALESWQIVGGPPIFFERGLWKNILFRARKSATIIGMHLLICLPSLARRNARSVQIIMCMWSQIFLFVFHTFLISRSSEKLCRGAPRAGVHLHGNAKYCILALPVLFIFLRKLAGTAQNKDPAILLISARPRLLRIRIPLLFFWARFTKSLLIEWTWEDLNQPIPEDPVSTNWMAGTSAISDFSPVPTATALQPEFFIG